MWPRDTTISGKRGAYTLTLKGLNPQVEDAVFCDIETLAWAPLDLERDGNNLHLHLDTNWALVILRRLGGPPVVGFDPLSPQRPGATMAFRVESISSPSDRPVPHPPVSVTAMGLSVSPPEVAVPGEVTLRIPSETLPGYYAVSVSGEDILGIKRFLTVE